MNTDYLNPLQDGHFKSNNATDLNFEKFLQKYFNNAKIFSLLCSYLNKQTVFLPVLPTNDSLFCGVPVVRKGVQAGRHEDAVI